MAPSWNNTITQWKKGCVFELIRMPNFESPPPVDIHHYDHSQTKPPTTIQLTLKQRHPECPALDFQILAPIDSKISSLISIVQDKHGGSLKNLEISSKGSVLASNKTLEYYGLVDNGAVLSYDYEVFSGPWLG